MSGEAAGPRLSVVIGSQNARRTLAECLAVLGRAGREPSVEIVVADASADGTADLVRERFPGVRLVTRSPGALVPELWAAGIAASRGPIVALTSAHCVPEPDWLHRVLQALSDGTAAVGGAIEPDADAGAVQWAVYFCRYSRYMLPFPAEAVDDLAADNAAYRRDALDVCRAAWADGFWEPTVHAALRRSGGVLRLDPALVVRHRGAFPLGRFLGQRFRHGRAFGRARALPGPWRRLLALAGPAIPLVLLGRIVRRVAARRRHRAALVRALPALGLFLAAWAAGEVVGYLEGPTA
jgi:glycosyltransferase involved in cell wall biosynthesis